MYAAVNRVSLRPDRGDQGIAIWRDKLVPLLRQQAGFRGVIVMRDVSASRGMSITTWDAETDFRAFERTDEARAHFGEIGENVLAGPREQEGYEVVVSELG